MSDHGSLFLLYIYLHSVAISTLPIRLPIYATLEVIKEVHHHNQNIYHRTVSTISPLLVFIRVNYNAHLYLSYTVHRLTLLAYHRVHY